MKEAFKACGLFPFDVENIDLSRVLPSIAASATPQEELWSQPEPNIVEVPTYNDGNAAVDRLQHFESLMEDSVLNLFRSSDDIWTGSSEYSILFTLWKHMFKEAAESMSTEKSEPLIVDVASFDGIAEDLTQEDVVYFSIIDGDDCTWLMEGNLRKQSYSHFHNTKLMYF